MADLFKIGEERYYKDLLPCDAINTFNFLDSLSKPQGKLLCPEQSDRIMIK